MDMVRGRGDRTDRHPQRGVVDAVVPHRPNRALADVKWKFVGCLAYHCSTFSRVGASGKPEAVQRARYMTLETIAGLSDDLAIRLPDVVI